MSIAILSIPLGIISIILFAWSISKMGNKPSKGKKKDDDTALIEIIVSVILFFVALGIYDGSASTAGLFNSDNAAQEEAASYSSDKNSEKSEAQREVEEYNKAAVEKARSGESEENSNNSNATAKSEATTNLKEANETTKLDKSEQNKNLEKQQKAYQQWRAQIEARIQSIDTTWSALWNDNSTDNTEKLIKALEHEKTQLEAIKVPEELSAMHKQKLNETESHYHQWIDSKLKACQMKSSKGNQQDIIAEVARGDGLKLRSNVEVSTIGRELGISNN